MIFTGMVMQGAETQMDGTLHFHGIAGIVGLPKTTATMTEALRDPAFVDRFTAYIDAISPPTPYLADSGPFKNSCPMEDCPGTLKALPFPGEAYCKRQRDQAPVNTAFCPDCETYFKHKDVLLRQIKAFAAKRKIDTNPLAVEAYRCRPPELSEDGELSDEDIVYLALNILGFQVHHESHTKSCFKITARTPGGKLCRYLFPRIARLEQTCIDLESGKITSSRLIGCEYYNICSLLWIRLSKNNMDIQFLINGGSRRSTSYSTKYTFKLQRPATALTMKIGLLSTAYQRTLSAEDDETITTLERGRRAINKSLWQLTKNQELHLTMAAYMLLNDGPFFQSHEVVYLNLKQMCACVVDDVIDDRRPGEEYLATDDEFSEVDSGMY
jgi:hypothetical protein